MASIYYSLINDYNKHIKINGDHIEWIPAFNYSLFLSLITSVVLQASWEQLQTSTILMGHLKKDRLPTDLSSMIWTTEQESSR